MNRSRTLAGAVTLALATAGIVSSLDSPTSANPAFDVGGSLSAPQSPTRGHAWIEGVITDRASNKALDNMQVEASPTGAPGDVVATSLTYESPDGSTKHGFYRLWGLEPGSYRVTFVSLDGSYRGASTVVSVENRQVLSLPVMLKRAQAATTTKASVGDDVISTAEKGKVVVTVAGSGKPAGDVEVRLGRKVVGDGQVRGSDRGRVTVTLDRLAVGSYDLKAYFLGSRTFEASSSKAVTLTVKKKPRRHH